MARPSKIQDMAEVKRWYEGGMTYQEMSDMYLEKYNLEVAPSTFSSVRIRQGWPGRLVLDNPLVPWRVKEEHSKKYLLAMLQREQRRRLGILESATHPAEVVLAWANSLRERGAVVTYEPDTEQGFFLTPARPGVDTDLVRVPDPE